MSDLISRQAAIDALKEHRALFCDNTPDTFSKLSYAEKSRVDELDMAIATLINLPSAQPERCEDCGNFNNARLLIPQPERKKGKWIKMSDADGIYWACSECGEDLPRVPHYNPQFDLFPRLKSIKKTKFCPNCGLRMEEQE